MGKCLISQYLPRRTAKSHEKKARGLREYWQIRVSVLAAVRRHVAEFDLRFGRNDFNITYYRL